MLGQWSRMVRYLWIRIRRAPSSSQYACVVWGRTLRKVMESEPCADGGCGKSVARVCVIGQGPAITCRSEGLQQGDGQ